MQRKIILSLSMCVLLIFAMNAAVFAAFTPNCSVSGPGGISAGETIQIVVTMVTNQDLYADIQTNGLEFVSTDDTLQAKSHKIELWGWGTGQEGEDTPGIGTISLTYTYRVTAQPGETASFKATNIHGFSESPVTLPSLSWSAVVPGQEPGGQPTAGSGNPAANIPAVSGYQAGYANERTYYVKVTGASMKFYLRSRTGKMIRVAVPSISAAGAKYYPLNHGGTVLWPIVEGGKLARYSIFSGGQEIPVLTAAEH